MRPTGLPAAIFFRICGGVFREACGFVADEEGHLVLSLGDSRRPPRAKGNEVNAKRVVGGSVVRDNIGNGSLLI